MRLFIAINFDDAGRRQILMLQDQLRAQSVRGNFSRPENLHLTLTFLGETPETQLPDLYKIVDSARQRLAQGSPLEIIFDRTGYFKRRASELWWLGASPNDAGITAVTGIHQQLMHQLDSNNINYDKKPFNAHITLAREVIHHQPIVLDCQPKQIKIERISLMKSEHIRGALTYTELIPENSKPYH